MKVFWFDCETSGLDHVKHGILSLGYIVEIDGEVRDEGVMQNRPFPTKELDGSALAVNGFTREQIAGFPETRATHARLRKLWGGYVNPFDRADKFTAAGYNVDFDLGFLRQLFADCDDPYFGSWFGFGVIDPGAILPFLKYAGRLDGFPVKMRLADAARFFGLEEPSTHDALTDIRITREIVKKVVSQLSIGSTAVNP